MTDLTDKHGYLDDFKELINGGWIMLFIFGLTICGLMLFSTIALLVTNNPEKIALLQKIFDTLIGFIAGAYTTMWNNQHFKEQKKDGNGVSLTYKGTTASTPTIIPPTATGDQKP